MENQTVSVRLRTGEDLGAMSVADFAARLKQDVDTKGHLVKMRSPHSGPGPNPGPAGVRFRNGRSRIRAAERWRAFSVVLHIAGTARTVYNKKKHPHFLQRRRL